MGHNTTTKAAAKFDSSGTDAQSAPTLAVKVSDLLAMRDTLALCAFASEALRVLNELEEFCNALPDLGARLDQLIDARREWISLPAPIDQVLKRATQQLDDLVGAA
ncbi:MAG: hypothetical protein KBF98_09910 [Rhodoferax sp.]|nr:hypothetical protein [Rhodoferax sp.]